MLKITEWLFTMGQNFQNMFKDHQAGDSIEGVLTFSDNNVMRVVVTANEFRN